MAKLRPFTVLLAITVSTTANSGVSPPSFLCPNGFRFVRSCTSDYAEPTEKDEDSDCEEDEVRLDHADCDFDFQEKNWTIQDQAWQEKNSGKTVKLIMFPTGSMLDHRVLHPYLYRRVKRIGTLDSLAETLGAPSDWLRKYEKLVAGSPSVILRFKRLVNLPNTAMEIDVREAFSEVVLFTATSLGVDLFCRKQTKVVVGGIMVRPEYDVRSKTDAIFVDIDGKYALASEVKRHTAFGLGQMWYRGCRGVRVFSSLYAFNAPTFLLTQKHWKIFVEDSSRCTVLTFPFNDDPALAPYVAASLLKPMGTTLLKALCICILARSPDSPPSSPSKQSERPSLESIVTPESKFVPERQWGSVAKELENKVTRDNVKIPFPSFVSGYDHGRPTYSYVRIIPEEEVL
jgi:hypothetical protein